MTMSTGSMEWHHEVHLLGRNEFSEGLCWVHSRMPKCTLSTKLQYDQTWWNLCNVDLWSSICILWPVSGWTFTHGPVWNRIGLNCHELLLQSIKSHQVAANFSSTELMGSFRLINIYWKFLRYIYFWAKTKPLRRWCVQSVLKAAGILQLRSLCRLEAVKDIQRSLCQGLLKVQGPYWPMAQAFSSEARQYVCILSAREAV